jgi:(p)ppGpp synthase/HD superfamily hydrolase
MSPTDLKLLARAADFAARAHLGQHRKGAVKEPYINHLTEVAELLADVASETDTALLAAAYLHDTLEDTATTYEDLAGQFGTDVASLVAEVTDDKALPKAERKRVQVETASRKSVRAQLLKIADKTSNLRSLLENPPAGWSRERLLEYIDWAEAVVSQLRGRNAALDAAFVAARDNARREILAKINQDEGK